MIALKSLLVSFCALITPVRAPRQLPTFTNYRAGGAQRPFAAHDKSAHYSSNAAVFTAAAATTALAAAAALRSVRSVSVEEDIPAYIQRDNFAASTRHEASSASTVSTLGYASKGRGRQPTANEAECANGGSSAQCGNDSEDDRGGAWDCDVDDADAKDAANQGDGADAAEAAIGDDAANEDGNRRRRNRPKGLGKLWAEEQFPEGVKDACDMRNLYAAQAWECRCPDRRNCIGGERFPDIRVLYEYRKTFQTTNGCDGGKRTATRKELENHYSTATREFSRSFVVGHLNDCCAASAGLAKGLPFGTFSRARTDVRKARPMREGRRQAKEQVESQAVMFIESHIREMKSAMEGSKGAQTGDVWYTAKMPIRKRYQQYCEARIRAKLPVVGSLSTFEKVWSRHKEIRQLGAKSHAKCDTCGGFQAEMDILRKRNNDPHMTELREKLDARREQHAKEHRGERDYAMDIYRKAEMLPKNVTAMNIDAPTQDQFDIPVQNRSARDVIKSLEGALKWKSKITGVMGAGVGMVAYVTRCGLGSGPNLTCTALYMMLKLIADKRGLGTRLNILFDNTSGDNKNNDVVAFIAWLVLTDVFQEASFFCMLKGHTYTILDQSFNTMISQLMTESIYTISSLLSFMFQFLRPYDVHDVPELHALWDWKAYLAPHYDRLGGFCSGQFGAGMHEVYCRKDEHGDVRIWLRASSQTTTWFPDGPGYRIFSSVPEGPPPLAQAKPDVKWSRILVEGTIRAWYRYMVVDTPGSFAKIKDAWQERFDSLPPADGNVNHLPDSIKPQWFDLPRTSQTLASSSAAPQPSSNSAGVSSALENPPVNPITGPGRSAADVQRELNAHRDRVRRATAGSENPAVFQTDYLFLQLPGKEVELHRVAHGLLIVDANCPNISFSTTELEHTPQPGIPGIWGTFSNKPNPGYNSHDPRFGPMHLRHHSVGRESSLVYSVDTFTDKVAFDGIERAQTVVRVSRSSFEQLAAVCSNMAALPSATPPTHSSTGAAGHRQQRRSGGQTAAQRRSAAAGTAASGNGSGGAGASQRGSARASSDRKRERDSSSDEEVGVSASSEPEEEADDDDPPPPIPEGYELVAWPGSVPLRIGQHFMIWTCVGRRSHATWHHAKVVRELDSSRFDTFTHDAVFVAERRAYPRGAALNLDAYNEGCWVLIDEQTSS